jgi:hypothetical protein
MTHTNLPSNSGGAYIAANLMRNVCHEAKYHVAMTNDNKTTSNCGMNMMIKNANSDNVSKNVNLTIFYIVIVGFFV